MTYLRVTAILQNMAHYKRYDAETVARTLALAEANGGAIRPTAREAGIPVMTVYEWIHGLAPAYQHRTAEKRRELQELTEEHAYEALGHAHEVVNSASYKDAMIGFGIAVEKMRLLREQPTSITKPSDPATLRERLKDLLLEKVAEGSLELELDASTPVKLDNPE